LIFLGGRFIRSENFGSIEATIRPRKKADRKDSSEVKTSAPLKRQGEVREWPCLPDSSEVKTSAPLKDQGNHAV